MTLALPKGEKPKSPKSDLKYDPMADFRPRLGLWRLRCA